MLTLFTRTTRLILAIPVAALLVAACGSSSGPSAGPAVPSLRSAAGYGILASEAVSCVTGGTVGGDIGISPGAGTNVTGFPPCTYTGTLNAANTAAATAKGDLKNAYSDLKGLACGTDISADLGGTTLAPGVYCSASSVGLTGDVTLDGQGHSDATFVIQAGSELTVAGAVKFIGSAQAKNVYWQVGSSATIGTGSAMKGNILALASITLADGATLRGRALARTGSVTLGTANTITLP